jgi:hypothetical protein
LIHSTTSQSQIWCWTLKDAQSWVSVRCRSRLLDVPSRRRLLFWACPHLAPLVAFEELYRAFVFLSFGQRRKRAQVAAFAGFRILLPRIQPVLSGFQFADHACQLSIVL